MSDSGSFYDRCWRGWVAYSELSPATRARRRRILRWLGEERPAEVLDVGCGNAPFLREALRRWPSLKAAGADVSPEVIEANRRDIPGAEFLVHDLAASELPRRYEAVVSMEVVEHCPAPLEAVARLARGTGRVLLLTAPCGPLFPIDRMVGHAEHLSPAAVRRTVEEQGLRVERCQAWGFPFFNLYKHLINVRPEAMDRGFLQQAEWGLGKRLLAAGVGLSFRFCLPLWGYQLFLKAVRP